ncbi:MAG: butyrate kinase [Mogibacterium sp.]|nr:butyrate kinase [Mogibacterium sp.]
MAYNILVINPGATSTKIGWFEDETPVFTKNIMHSVEELDALPTKLEKIQYRKKILMQVLKDEGFDVSKLDAIAARGGTIFNMQGGAYEVNDDLVEACLKPENGHASNYAAVIGKEIADELGIKAYIYDAVGTNETLPIARMTGLKGIIRKNGTHALNTRAVAKKAAKSLGRKYADCCFVVVHMGGGVSINIHKDGKIIDTISTGEGPMSTTRAGVLSTGEVLNMATSGNYTKQELREMFDSKGGLISLLGTNDLFEVEDRYKAGDPEAVRVLEFWAYQLGKYTALMASVGKGQIDQIILTGGPAYCKPLTDLIIDRVGWIAPVNIIPGALEMEALASGVLEVLHGEEVPKLFHIENYQSY